MGARRWWAAVAGGLVCCTVPAMASAAPNVAEVQWSMPAARDSDLNGTLLGGVDFGSVSPLTAVAAGQQLVGGSGAPGPAPPMISLGAGGHYALVTAGQPTLPLLVVNEDVAAAEPGRLELRLAMATAYPLPMEVGLGGGALLDADLRTGDVSAPLAVAPGSHLLDVYSLGGYPMGSVPISGDAGEALTVVLTGTPGGSAGLEGIEVWTPQWVGAL